MEQIRKEKAEIAARKRAEREAEREAEEEERKRLSTLNSKPSLQQQSINKDLTGVMKK